MGVTPVCGSPEGRIGVGYNLRPCAWSLFFLPNQLFALTMDLPLLFFLGRGHANGSQRVAVALQATA